MKTFARELAVMMLVFASAVSGGVLEEIRDLNARYGGKLGVMAKNLATGETIAYNADERFPTASVIKLPVMAAYFDLVAKKKIDPATRITLTAQDKKPGSGVLQFMRDGATVALADAVTLMIDLSDNTATNLVLDCLGPTHEARMNAVNDFLAARGMHNTKLLNRLFSWETKQRTPEAMRFGVGVATPADMILLLEQLYARTLVDSAGCDGMMAILKEQFYNDMIPRFLPSGECKFLSVAHKTGSLNEVRADVGLILSDRGNFAIAIFVDKSPDHGWDDDNSAALLGARIARTVWNHFTGMTGEERGRVNTSEVDWTQFPGGRWGIYRSPYAPFPHPERASGFTGSDGTRYPWFPHYADSSIVVFVPQGFYDTTEGANVIVHFHGHLNDNVGTLERYAIPQAMIAMSINALLILPQGPYRARDSFGGKMEEEGGFRRMVEDVMATMKREQVVTSDRIARVIVSAHSGGFRPAGFVLSRGGLSDRVTHVFLFDALYGQHESFRDWLLKGGGTINAAYTGHLAKLHAQFASTVVTVGNRWSMTATSVDHEQVVQTFMPGWLAALPAEWKFPPSQKTN